MRKLPLLRQGQAFDYKIINQIISAINESIIEQPKYQSMMNDLAAVTNNYTTSIESFISRYRDVVENTPTLHELLVAYAALQDKANGSTQSTMVNVPYVNLQFVYNPNEETGIFELNGNTPSVGSVRVENGQCVIAGVKNGGDFTDTKIFVNCGTADDLSFLCLDLIRGPQGPTGPQGAPGDTGAAGKDGENGRLVKLKGKIELTAGETIGLRLTALASESTIEIGDGWVYENAEGGPVVYVYVGEGAIGVEPEYPKFITIKTMRGPAGPAGPASELDICFSETDESDKIKYDKLDPDTSYYFMWIKILTANMTDEQKNNMPYHKIRIRQRDISIEPHASFTYEVKEGGETVKRQTDEEGTVTVVRQSIDDTTENQKYIFRFKDPKEISDVDFDEDGHLVFDRTYVNAGEPAEALKTEGRVHTPTLYFDGSPYITPYINEEMSNTEIVTKMAIEASIKYRSFAIYKTPDGQDLQVWEINYVSGVTQVTKRSSLFMNIISRGGVWCTQQGDQFIPLKAALKADEECDARSIPDFKVPTNARPEYGKDADGKTDLTRLCFSGKELSAGDNYLVAKTFNFYDDSRIASICEAYISDGNQWIKILETESVRGDKPYLVVKGNTLYYACIVHNQTEKPSDSELIELCDFSGAFGGLTAEDISALGDIIEAFRESDFNTLIEDHNGDSDAHQDIRDSINNHTHGIDKIDGLQAALELHTHPGYVTIRNLDARNYVDNKKLTSEIMDQISAHDGRTDTHQDIRQSIINHSEDYHAHQDIRSSITSLESSLENCATKAQVNGMFSYNAATKTLTITTLT